MGNQSKNLRTTLPGGRRINLKSQIAATKIDTSKPIQQHLADIGLSLSRSADMDRYASGLIAYKDAMDRGESEANAIQAGLAATKITTETREKQISVRERKIGMKKYGQH